MLLSLTCSHGPHGEPLRVDVKLVLTNFDFNSNLERKVKTRALKGIFKYVSG